MTIDVYAVAHNEALMVPYFLRHYGAFARHLYVWEDESTDGTREMLAAHPAVTLLPLDRHGVDDLYWVRELFPQYLTRSADADWVIFVDLDEFVYHPALRDMLYGAAAEGVRLIECDGYQMVSDAPPSGDGQIYHEIRDGFPDMWQSKSIVVAPTLAIIYSPGRHAIQMTAPDPSAIKWDKGRPFRESWLITSEMGDARPVGCTDTGIKLLHYRWFGLAYAEQRSAENLARMSATNVKQKWHKHNRRNDTGPHSVAWFEAKRREAVRVV